MLTVASSPVNAQSTPEIAPGVDIRLGYSYYEVSGRDATEVLHSLRRNGPESDGGRYFGITQSRTGLSYQLVSSRAGCSIANLGVRTDITITLPKWDPPHSTAPELRRQWDMFLEKLTEHEHWHADASRKGAHDVHDAIRALRSASCSELEVRAKRIAEDISARVERENNEYDRATDHGRKSGIVWRH